MDTPTTRAPLPPLTLRPVQTARELRQFVTFPARLYRGDPHWVAPLIDDQVHLLDPAGNPYWRTARRALWLAWRGGRPVGGIAAIVDAARMRALGQAQGAFGFFECEDDLEAARALVAAAADWRRAAGCTSLIGPYNPTPDEMPGILVDGFDTRPALLEGHHPPYYAALLEAAGLRRDHDLVARLFRAPPEARTLAEVLPAKLQRAAELAERRLDLRVRPLNFSAWDAEIALATRLFNESLADLPGFAPMAEATFRELAQAFRPILDPDLAHVAEIAGRPAGFALALPDFNEALQAARGRLWPLGFLRVWWRSRRLRRCTVKMLMILPAYQGRGVEAVLGVHLARAIWARGYREVDCSLMGDENVKSNRLQEHLGLAVSRRYRLYTQEL